MSSLHSRDWLTAARLRFPELLRLHNPETAQHLVQFYDNDDFLIHNVCYNATKALAAGSSVVILATESHLQRINDHLTLSATDFDNLHTVGRYVTVDAAQALAQFMTDRDANEAAFDRVIGSAIRDAAMQSENGFVFVFGEMVALLCEAGNPEGALHLEQLWNHLAKQQRFSLYCAYPLSSFDSEPTVNVLARICSEHALAIPVESSRLF